MITAYLYLGLNLRLDRPIKIFLPREYIRIMLEHPLQEEKVKEAKVSSDNNATTAFVGTDTDFNLTSADSIYYTIDRYREPHAVFRRWEQIDARTYVYMLEGLSDFPLKRFASSMLNIEDIGFREPDKNVNLRKLRRKLRSKKKMKELLLKYFRS